MRLGLNLTYWSTAEQAADTVALARAADDLGYAVVWTAEAWGSDVVSTLAFVAAQTKTIDVGAAIMQIPARTPAMTAMTAASMDALSHGRFRLGLGVSGPQVSEGWHGVRYEAPLTRTREYIDIVKKALAREKLTYDGKFNVLPLPDGPGKALKLMVHPFREHIPIYLAALGPKNLELCGEISDGWLAIFYSPGHAKEPLSTIEAGARRAGRDGLAGFDVVPTVPLSVGADLNACAQPVSYYVALYVGGMGSREQNFYNQLARRYGYDQAAGEIQDHYLAQRQQEAAAAVPFELIDETSLLGPKERIRDRLVEFAESGVTTISVAPFGSTLDERIAQLRTCAEALDASGVAG